MAEGVLFSIAEEISKKLGGLAAQEVALSWRVKDQLMKLNGTVTRIKAVIQDAEEKAQKQKQNHQIKDWLKKLGGAIYDAEDLLDDFTTEIQQKQLMPGNKVSREVRFFFSKSNQFVYGSRMGHKVKALWERLDAIDADSKRFNLDIRDDETDFLTTDGRQTTSSEPEVIVGREGDKLAVKTFLLNSNYNENVSVVSIVGIGGLGKTTLAQHVFNDEQVKAHFGERRLWVSVSGVLGKDSDQLESLKNELKKIIEKKEENEEKEKNEENNYLLVLDDVWDSGVDGRDAEKWDNLKQGLPRDAVGSKIIVTARSEVIAKFTSTIDRHVLKGLSDDESWDLFRRKAFRQDEQSGHVDDKIREEIVKRCCGVPLVIKTIARLMSLKDRALWSSFIRNELPDPIIDENIIQTIMLSYNALPSYMKPCFAYCSLFPKGHRIDVKSLFQLWIAQGFIRSSNSVDSGESVALMCFESLLWRSFFQEVEKDNLGNIKSCKMHDFMHDLATHVAGFERTEVEIAGNRIRGSTWHVSLDMELNFLRQISTILPWAKRLRTLVLKGGKWNERAWESICRNFGHLRVLVLNSLRIRKVSPLIEKLKLLKYLDLSDNQMEALPNSITNLVNLQVLKLNWCQDLKMLPRDMYKLINLRHLDVCCSLFVGSCNLEYMPLGIGQLTSLQTLSRFVVAKNSSHKSKMVGGLDELKKLNELRGSLEISVKEYERNSWIMSEFKGAILKDKHNLQSLTIWWDPKLVSNSDIDLNDEMLQNLQPNLYLQELKVESYGGMRFPSWLSHLSNLVRIHLEDCVRLQHIPPLDGMPSLEELYISSMRSLEYIDSEGVGGKGVSTFFPSLKKLSIQYCERLKGWWKKSSDEMNDEIMLCFPRLSSLEIVKCGNLTSMPLFPTLDKLQLFKSSSMPLQQTMKMTAPVSSYSSSSIDTFIRPLSKLKELYIHSVKDMESLPEIGLQNLSSLQQLVIIVCSRLKSLPLPDEGMHSLQILSISLCGELKCLSQSESQGVIPSLPSLQHLRLGAVSEELSGRIRGWGKESDEEWPIIIQHIPNIVIDDYYIQKDGRYVKEDEISY